MKGIKTTLVAVICLILGLTIFIMWFFKKLENDQLTLGLASIGTFGTAIGLLFAKDSDKSHSRTGGHPDPDKEEK